MIHSRRSSLLGLVGLIVAAFGLGNSLAQNFYPVTIHNNFASTEFYGANVPSSNIFIVTNFGGNYDSISNDTTVTNPAGTWITIPLSDMKNGVFNLERTPGGTRMYAVLSTTAPPAAQPSATTSSPNNYFEWSFGAPAPSNNPGVLDFSWIDRYDFPSRMVISGLPNNAHTGVSTGMQVFGAKANPSVGTTQIGNQLASYLNTTTYPSNQYAWLGTVAGGFSQNITYPGATNPIGWTTRNSNGLTIGEGATIKSLTDALTQIQQKAATSPAPDPAAAPGTDKNWTTNGFRIGYPSAMMDPATGSVSGAQWTAYVNFTGNLASGFTMVLSDFDLFDSSGNHLATSDTAMELTQAQGMLEAIWMSSFNIVSPSPAWVTNLGGNKDNVMYEIYNAIASGVIYHDDFLNDTPLPAWTGYSPRIAGVDTYNYEILLAGAPVDGGVYPTGLQGYLSGADVVALLEERLAAGDLVNPYFLELLKIQQQTPAYLYPSQDSWNFVGTDSVLGMQPQPLNGQAAWGDSATLAWYLGNNVAASVTPTPTPTPTPAPEPAPKVNVKGKKKITTNAKQVKIKGTAKGAEVYIKYKKPGGKMITKRIKIKPNGNWLFKFKPKARKSVLKVYAENSDGEKSKTTKIRVIDKRF